MDPGDQPHALREDGRLRKRSEFLATARGRRFRTELMTIQAIMRTDAPGGIRVGFTVSRKVGRATERNRIRRRLRHAVRAARENWPRADIDVVVVARRAALDAPFPRLVKDLTRALPKLMEARASAGRGPKATDLKI